MNVRAMVRSFLNVFYQLVGFRLVRVRRRPAWPGEKNRFDYQKLYNKFDIRPGAVVLELGSGGDPFPQATILTDRYVEPTRHRFAKLVIDQRPFFISQVERIPLADKSVDFIYCSHVLEHVDDPLQACAEIVRVGKRGYIETPTAMKDILFSWAKGMHKWQVLAVADKLMFIEYGPRELEGVGSTAWSDQIFSAHYQPMQELFYNNQDLFNVMFNWQDGFECFVFYRDGRVEHRKL